MDKTAVIMYLPLLFSDDKWSPCYGFRDFYGVYIWTAGQRVDPKPKSKFVWKVTTDIEKAYPEFRNQDLVYTNWDTYQPDLSWTKLESCLNLWRKRGYKWNDEPCDHKYCFVCEAIC